MATPQQLYNMGGKDFWVDEKGVAHIIEKGERKPPSQLHVAALRSQAPSTEFAGAYTKLPQSARSWPGDYAEGSAYTGYFPQGAPAITPGSLVPPENRRPDINDEIQQLRQKAQKLRADWDTKQYWEQTTDWLIPDERAKLDSGEITQSQATEMGNYRKRKWMEAKAAREEKQRPKSEREQFQKNVIDNEFGGKDPRFLYRPTATKQRKGLILAGWKEAYKKAHEEPPTGTTLFEMDITAGERATNEIANETDAQIGTLTNLIKAYDDQQRADREAAIKAQAKQKAERIAHERELQIIREKEALFQSRPPKTEQPELKPNQALSQINSIIRAKTTIDKTNTVSDAILAMISKDDPEAAQQLAPFLGRKLSKEDKLALEEIWRVRIEYLLPFIPEGFRPNIKGYTAPRGLSEEDIKFNMEKYGKTRQEVIDQYNNRAK